MWGLINFYHAGERASRSSNQDDVNNPAKLVRELSSTVAGCDWLLQQFAELRELLEFDNAWEGHHKLKCIRLLGRSPLDCANVREVAEIFVATWSIRSVRSGVYSRASVRAGPDRVQAVHEAGETDLEEHDERALDLDNSRRILVSIVERAMARVRAQSAVARERAARDAQRRADCLLFDDSMEGERLRRYEASSSRTMLRSISEFFKVRRATEDGDFEPSLEAAATVEAENGQAGEQYWHPEIDSFDLGEPIDQGNTIEQNFANEPNAATGQNFANEPNAASEQNFANEPNAASEQSFANEPNAASEQSFANEPNAACEQNCANEPNAASAQNLGNEPNVATEQNFANEPNVVSEQSFVNKPNAFNEQDLAIESDVLIEQSSTIEPNVPSEQNSTTEPNAGSEHNFGNEPNVVSEQKFANEPSDDDERDLDDRAADSPPARFGENPHRDRDEGQKGRGGPGPIGERDRRVLENIPIPAGSRVPELTHMIDFLKARAEIRRDLDEALDRLRQSISAGEFGDSQSSVVKHPPTASLAPIDADGMTSLTDAEQPTSIARGFFPTEPNDPIESALNNPSATQAGIEPGNPDVHRAEAVPVRTDLPGCGVTAPVERLPAAVALIVSIVLLICCSALAAVSDRRVNAPDRDGQPAVTSPLRQVVSPRLRLEDRPEGTEVHEMQQPALPSSTAFRCAPVIIKPGASREWLHCPLHDPDDLQAAVLTPGIRNPKSKMSTWRPVSIRRRRGT